MIKIMGPGYIRYIDAKDVIICEPEITQEEAQHLLNLPKDGQMYKYTNDDAELFVKVRNDEGKLPDGETIEKYVSSGRFITEYSIAVGSPKNKEKLTYKLEALTRSNIIINGKTLGFLPSEDELGNIICQLEAQLPEMYNFNDEEKENNEEEN